MEHFVNEVHRLSQEEGLYDMEIAEQLGCHRTTITRCRIANNIPRPNLKNRRDKYQRCNRCGSGRYIRRKERITKYCEACIKLIRVERNAKKLERYYARKQK